VGKSALVQMFHSKGTHFPKQYQMTTGCDFVMKEIKLPESGAIVELHIYDCAGQAVFKELTTSYWKNANMVMLVYDVTNPDSFQHLGPWLDLVRKKCPEKILPGVVVANKIDLEERQRVDIPDGQEFAKSNNLEFCQVSAQRNQNVEKPFEMISQIFYTAYEVLPLTPFHLSPPPSASAPTSVPYVPTLHPMLLSAKLTVRVKVGNFPGSLSVFFSFCLPVPRSRARSLSLSLSFSRSLFHTRAHILFYTPTNLHDTGTCRHAYKHVNTLVSACVGARQYPPFP